MPVIEHELENARGATFFADFDMIHGYWQFLIHPEEHETQTIIFPDGLMDATRLLHGHVNANTHHLKTYFMSKMSESLKSRLLLWVDDMVIPGTTFA